MPVYFNKDTGLAEDVAQPGEMHEIPLVSPDGQIGSAPAHDASELLKQGYRQPNKQEMTNMLKEAHFNEPMEQLKTGLEGAASGATLGLSTGIERALGANPENINARAQYNPGIHGAGEIAGIVGSSLTGVGEGALMAKAGEAAASRIASRLGEGTVSNILQKIGRGAAENAIYGTGNEMSKFISEDPTQTAETAMSNIGLGAVIGGGVGGALGATRAGFEGLMETKAGKFISDFKNRLSEHLNDAETATIQKPSTWSEMIRIKGMPPEARGKIDFQDIAPEPEKLTLGMKAADALIKKGIGETIGAGVGGIVGSKVGHPYWGMVVGEKLLADKINSVLPVIMRPLMSAVESGSGLRAAMDYGVQAIKGENRLSAAVANIFNASKTVISEPDIKDLNKLKQRLDEVAANPASMMQVGGDIGHYMPDHATALGETAAKASQYLNQQKPENPKQSPLDGDAPLSKPQSTDYNQALMIAQEPLIVVGKIKDGSIAMTDIKHLKAMYPALYNRINMKMISELGDAQQRGYNIPYKTKLGMSTFMGQPLETSMRSANIVANQATFARPPAIQAPRAPSASRMSGLNKMPGLSQLPGQAREAYKSTGHR